MNPGRPSITVPGNQGQGCPQVPTRIIAHHGQPGRIHVEGWRHAVQPAQGGVGIFRRGGKRLAGGQGIGEGQHQGPSLFGNLAGGEIRFLQAARDETTTMQVEDSRGRAGAIQRLIDAHRQGPQGAGQLLLADTQLSGEG